MARLAITRSRGNIALPLHHRGGCGRRSPAPTVIAQSPTRERGGWRRPCWCRKRPTALLRHHRVGAGRQHQAWREDLARLKVFAASSATRYAPVTLMLNVRPHCSSLICPVVSGGTNMPAVMAIAVDPAEGEHRLVEHGSRMLARLCDVTRQTDRLPAPADARFQRRRSRAPLCSVMHGRRRLRRRKIQIDADDRARRLWHESLRRLLADAAAGAHHRQ